MGVNETLKVTIAIHFFARNVLSYLETDMYVEKSWNEARSTCEIRNTKAEYIESGNSLIRWRVQKKNLEDAYWGVCKKGEKCIGWKQAPYECKGACWLLFK